MPAEHVDSDSSRSNPFSSDDAPAGDASDAPDDSPGKTPDQTPDGASDDVPDESTGGESTRGESSGGASRVPSASGDGGTGDAGGNGALNLPTAWGAEGQDGPSRPVVVSVEENGNGAARPQPKTYKDRTWLHLLLFLLTVASTVYVGGVFAGRVGVYEAQGYSYLLWDGIQYSLALLGALTVHEFGHYFAARHHRIKTSLPYYIPLPVMPIGTLGAVIRIREPIPSERKLFDIGAAGPLAGFVVSLGALLYAFATLPPPEYLLDLGGHEALKEHIRQFGTFPDTMPPSEGGEVIVLGETLLYWILAQFFDHVPPMYEMYHYPVLYAGWLGLFFTALNLLPVGQLDGGHILYALFGETWHRRLARGFVLLLLLSGSIGFLQSARPELYAMSEWLGHATYFILAAILFVYLYRTFDGDHRYIATSMLAVLALARGAMWLGEPFTQFGYSGWLVWTALIVFFVRVDHPPVRYREPLTPTRRLLGYISIAIFFLCFSFRPIYLV
jgi:membrane-associated protease RseP (regulator of RpoE activity)